MKCDTRAGNGGKSGSHSTGFIIRSTPAFCSARWRENYRPAHGPILRLRLLEEQFPALEERRERVAAALVRGEDVDVRPVRRELLLELGDLCLLRGDRGFELLEFGGTRLLRSRWLRL